MKRVVLLRRFLITWEYKGRPSTRRIELMKAVDRSAAREIVLIAYGDKGRVSILSMKEVRRRDVPTQTRV